MKFAFFLVVIASLALSGCINFGGPSTSPTFTPMETPTPVASETPTVTEQPSATPTPVATTTPTPTPSPSPTPLPSPSPKCTMTAAPEMSTGSFESVVSALFENLPANTTTATLKCTASANASTTDITSAGRAFKTCYYPIVQTQTIETASASAGGTSCSIAITNSPKAGPEISNVSYTLLNYSAARINWNTNIDANGSVDYGTSSSFGSSKNDTAVGTLHAVTLTGLSASTTYYFRPVSCFTTGGCTQGASITFPTGAGDSVAPTVTLNSPADNVWLTSTSQTLSYTPLDSNGIVNCSLYLNSTGTFALDTTSYSVTNNTANSFAKTLTESAFLWNVKCADASANAAFASSNRTLKIDATPPSPATGLTNTSVTNQTVDLSWTAATDSFSGVSLYMVFRNSANVYNVTAPTVVYPDQSLANGTLYTYSVKAVDVAGNQGAASTDLAVTTLP